MKKFCVFFVLLLYYVIFICGLCSPIYAESSGQRVYDNASLFTQEEEELLEASISSLKSKINMDIVIVTEYSTGGKSSMEYADDFYDQNGFGTGNDFNGALLLIDMYNREVYISTCGKMINHLTDSRIDAILDIVQPNLTKRDYYTGANSFLKRIELYFPGSLTPGEIALAVIVPLIVGIIGILIVNSRYSKPATVYKYPLNQKSKLDLTANEDIFVNKTVTHRRISSSSGRGNRSGGSSTHRSSSGRSHGGGGRKF